MNREVARFFRAVTWWAPRALAMLVLLAAATCRTPPLVLADDLGPADLALPPQPPPQPPPTGCLTHTLTGVPLSGLSFLDPGPMYQGATIRLRADLSLRAGCDVPANMQVSEREIGLPTDVSVLLQVWRGPAGCAGPMQTVTRIIQIGVGLVGPVYVHDIAPGATRSLTFVAQPTPPSSCTAVASGQPCDDNCQCPGPTDCIGGRCAQYCWEDSNCADPARPRCNPTANPPYSCDVVDPSGACGPCPFGQSCAAGVCKPDPNRPIFSPCKCDADCGAGRVCDDQGGCRIPCAVQRDCPPGDNVCGGACDSTT